MFFKLFFWFWLAMTLSGLVFFLLAFTMRLGPIHDKIRRDFSAERTRIVEQALALYGRTAAEDFERGGHKPVMEGGLHGAPPGLRAFLFAADGTPISRGVPPPVREQVLRFVARSGSGATTERIQDSAIIRVTSQTGKRYIAAVEDMPPPPPPRMPPPGFPFLPNFLSRFCITFVIGGLVCYGLAWHFTGPIRKLRAAAQGLAKGDLSTRVVSRNSGPGDEVTDLVRDFNRMAERIEVLVTARKQLVRDVSHELRSPLARLNVALALARREANPPVSASLDRIEREAERLNSIIGDLLSLSLMESGAGIERKPFDLTHLVEEVVRDAEYEAAHRGRHVRFAGQEPLELVANRELLRRALENVMRNGVRHTGEGTEVEVRLEREGSGHAVISVRDRGPGVPEDALRDIFRPFYRLETARERTSGGTGLGLSIAERSVRLHGGTVEAANREDGGLMVIIRLPLSLDQRESGHA